MHENGEEILKNTLKNNPVILEEWKKRKMCNKILLFIYILFNPNFIRVSWET